MKKLILIVLIAVAPMAFAQESEMYEGLKAEIAKIKADDSPDGNDRQVWNILVKLDEEVMQGDTGEITEETIVEFGRLMKDTGLKNRHLLALLQLYQANISGDDYSPELQNAVAKLLLEESYTVYGSVPCLVLIYGCETMMSNGKDANAAEHAKVGLEYYPESIPLQVYRHKLTTDANEKKQLHDKLLKEHPDHWLVKQFLKP